jgi:hypothetical protein
MLHLSDVCHCIGMNSLEFVELGGHIGYRLPTQNVTR